ncbi:hypothetical protein ACS0TY_017791 [Phlomoides rotata]
MSPTFRNSESFYPNSFLPRFHPLFSTLFPDCNAASPWCHLHPTPPPPRVPATAAPPTTAKRKIPPHPQRRRTPLPFAIRHHCLAPPTGLRTICSISCSLQLIVENMLLIRENDFFFCYQQGRKLPCV